jgi:hemerythrin-like domain-containing protein
MTDPVPAVTGAQSGPAPGPPGRSSLPGRRAVLLGGGLAAGAAGASAVWALAGPSGAVSPAAPSGIPPDDDLMREHGVLKRVLLCYREMVTQIQAGQPVTGADLNDAALIIHDYIEGFHEPLEEGFVFPRLRQAGVLNSTVTTLLVQHARGRVLTQFLLTHAVAGMGKAGTRTQLAAAMQAFVRMYEPHEAREDTVVFPAFRQVVPVGEFADLGQQFAELERQQFGVNEFAAMVARVASIEQNLGIYDLSQFTPQVSAFAPEA